MMLTHKTVNVISRNSRPLYFLKINTSLVYNITLPLSDILLAIQMDCIVEEKTKNGIVKLNIDNFYTDFNVSNDDDMNDVVTLCDVEPEKSNNTQNIIENKSSFIHRLLNEQNNIKNKRI